MDNGAFYALFMTSKGLVVTQYHPEKQQKMCLYERYVLCFGLINYIIYLVSADGSSRSSGGLTAQIGWFGLRVGGHPALSLHSSNEPGELSQ